MADLAMSVQLSREYLGLTPLELNDEIRYKVGRQFMGGTVDWDRVTASSAYMDGEVTVSRKKQMVTEACQFEIYGSTSPTSGLTPAAMKANHEALVDAVSQHAFTITIVIDGVTYKYQCEASGYTMVWDGLRFMAVQGQMTVNLRRQPNPLVGRV